MNITRNERHSNPLILGHGLQTANEIVSFLLQVWLSNLTSRGQSLQDTL